MVPGHNLKIIALNGQAGDYINLYLIKNPTDPGSMMSKLK